MGNSGLADLLLCCNLLLCYQLLTSVNRPPPTTIYVVNPSAGVGLSLIACASMERDGAALLDGPVELV